MGKRNNGLLLPSKKYKESFIWLDIRNYKPFDGSYLLCMHVRTLCGRVCVSEGVSRYFEERVSKNMDCSRFVDECEIDGD